MLRTPLRVEPDSERKSSLLLVWNSGESYSVPYLELRYECPCAVCVDEKTGKRIITRESIDEHVRPLEVYPVGRYALQFRWSDSHATGMYHFDRLFQICEQVGLKRA